MNQEPDQNQIRSAFHLYLQVYFSERGYEKTVKLFHPQFCVIGTASDEIAFSFEESLALYARDIAQYQEPIAYELTFCEILLRSPDCGLVMAGINLILHANGMDTRIDGLRMSAVYYREETKWLLQHLHISQEQHNLAAGESFPLVEMEEKNRQLERMVREKTVELNRALERIERLAVTDELTGLFNRRRFDEVLKYELHRANDHGRTVSVILGDLDFFKKVNDKFGHLMGDRVLKEVSRILKENLRFFDTVARWGGEEFIVLLPDTPRQEAVRTAERIRVAFGSAMLEAQLGFTISFGVAEFVAGDTDDSLLSRADYALYQAKLNGRNRVEYS